MSSTFQPVPCATWTVILWVALFPSTAWSGQDLRPPSGLSDEQVGKLFATLDDMRHQLGQTVAELHDLRLEVSELRSEIRDRGTGSDDRVLTATWVARTTDEPKAMATMPRVASLQEAPRLSRLEEEQALQRSMLETLYQSKVESGSKYRVRLSGMALFNAFVTGDLGGENFDVPKLAEPYNPLHSGTSFGTTMRQSLLGVDVSGPTLAGARTRGELRFDFFGGFPRTGNGSTAGLARLRTGALRLEWTNTSVVLGQTEPFVSPLSPTSLASVAVPALSYSGNLWAWVPQVSVEQRRPIAGGGTITMTGGVLDPLTGDKPAHSTYSVPGAGHRSGLPAVAGRLGWQSDSPDRPVAMGVGGYYSRQDWGLERFVNGWATTADWVVPLGNRVSLTGEFYTGRAFGGLGAGHNGSVRFDGDPGNLSTNVLGLRSTGGWLQAKLNVTNRIELNTAMGQDSPSGEDLERFRLNPRGDGSPIGRNRTGFINIIVRARSNLLFSGEFRSIVTERPDGTSRRVQHFNFAAGVLF